MTMPHPPVAPPRNLTEYVDFVTSLVSEYVSHPSGVHVSTGLTKGGFKMVISTHQEDMGKLIGKEGKNISALKKLVAVASRTRDGVHGDLFVLDTEALPSRRGDYVQNLDWDGWMAMENLLKDAIRFVTKQEAVVSCEPCGIGQSAVDVVSPRLDLLVGQSFITLCKAIGFQQGHRLVFRMPT